MATRKKLDDESAAALSLEERLEAYVHENYELRPEDQEIMEAVDMAFRLIHTCEDVAKARKLLHRQFPQKNKSHLIRLATVIYGDFFHVNREAMRITQHLRYERWIRKAEAAGELDVVDRMSGKIDKLFGLYDQTAKEPNKAYKLPRVSRSSDTQVLEAQ
ncbi:MAG: hypothetical protein AAFU67_14305, partial [Bacteroidota bacterium]